MTRDATFEDGGERALRLRAETPDDVGVISAILQDAVFPAKEMTWDRRRRRFAVLLNRFRWEDVDAARREGRRPERVRALLVVEDVLGVATQEVRKDDETVLSLLSLDFEAGEDGTGALLLTLAGDGAIRLDVEAVSLVLKDVTRPYSAPSGRVPDHGV